MKRIALIVALAATPAAAQDSQVEEGADLLSRGVELLLRGLMDQAGPALRELRDRIDDLDAYYPPEILPNGDIIIRRKTPLEPELPPVDEDGIEL